MKFRSECVLVTYASFYQIVDQETLEAVEEIKTPIVFCIAAWFGKVRLIDNMEINIWKWSAQLLNIVQDCIPCQIGKDLFFLIFMQWQFSNLVLTMFSNGNYIFGLLFFLWGIHVVSFKIYFAVIKKALLSGSQYIYIRPNYKKTSWGLDQLQTDSRVSILHYNHLGFIYSWNWPLN